MAVGTDVDGLAVRAAGRNAELNGVSPAFISLLCDPSIDGPNPADSPECRAAWASASNAGSAAGASGNTAGGGGASVNEVPEGFPDASFDVCIANILRGPLVELKPRLAGYVRPGGRIILSGILQEQAPEIQEAYRDEFESFEMQTEGSWALLTAVKTRTK